MIGGEEIAFETQTIDAPLTIDGENEGEVSLFFSGYQQRYWLYGNEKKSFAGNKYH